MNLDESLILSHLQFAVIRLLCSEGQKSGRMLRLALEQIGIRQSRPSFYELMARLSAAGLIEGRLNEKMIREIGVKETLYKVTPLGKKALHYTRDFYSPTVISQCLTS